MNDSEFRKLIKKHTKTQEKANCLFSDILSELGKRKIENEIFYSCLHTTEPAGFEEELLKLLGEVK